jgi:hypothetical protein
MIDLVMNSNIAILHLFPRCLYTRSFFSRFARSPPCQPVKTLEATNGVRATESGIFDGDLTSGPLGARLFQGSELMPLVKTGKPPDTIWNVSLSQTRT